MDTTGDSVSIRTAPATEPQSAPAEMRRMTREDWLSLRGVVLHRIAVLQKLADQLYWAIESGVLDED